MPVVPARARNVSPDPRTIVGGTMFVQQFATGGDRNFGYLVADEDSNQAAIVDASYPSPSSTSLAARLPSGLCLSTHAHATSSTATSL